MSSNREWMYSKRFTSAGTFNLDFVYYVNQFLEFAYLNATNKQRRVVDGVEVVEIRCPCARCKNIDYRERKVVRDHLCEQGFKPDYSIWYAHGERFPTQEIGQSSNPSNPEPPEYNNDDVGDFPRYEQMVIERMHQPEASYYQQKPQDPNQSAKSFYNLVNQASVLLLLIVYIKCIAIIDSLYKVHCNYI